MIILPLPLLIIIPTQVFSRVSKYLTPRWNISIKTLADTFHGCYKDGTDGTQDYRVVSGYLLVAFALLPVVHTLTHPLIGAATVFQAIVPLTFFITLTAVFVLLQPYKHSVADYSAVTLSTIYVLAIALYSSFCSYSDSNVTVVILIALLLNLPHCVFYGYLGVQAGETAHTILP